MRLLLINNNPAVSKLINLSAEKLGYEIDEINDDSVDLKKSFDITITDSDSVDESSFLLLKESGGLGKVVYIGSRGIQKPEFADYMLYKPFLPTDFVELLKEIGKTIEMDMAGDNTQEEVIDDFPMEAYDDDVLAGVLDAQEIKDAKDGLDLDDLDMIASVPNELLQFDDDLDTKDAEQNDEAEDEAIETINQDHQEEEKDDALSVLEQEDATLTPSILDQDDVDQVKQLLVDEEILQNDEVPEEDKNEGIQIAQIENETHEDESLKFEDDDISELMFDSNNAETETSLEPEEESSILSEFGTQDKTEKNSIDDLCEEDFDGIFEEDLTNVKEALQASVVEDVKKVLNREELKEALKGFKVNISISIDEL